MTYQMGNKRCISYVFLFAVISASHGLRFKRQSFKDSVIKEPYRPQRDETAIKNLSFQMENLSSKMDSALSNVTKMMNELHTLSEKSQIIENKIKSLESKVEDIEVSADTDADYFNSSETCGGILISQTGRISYLASYLDPMMRCVWTIRANYRSKIEIRLTTISPVVVTEFLLAKHGAHSVRHTTISSVRSYVFKGPLVMVSSNSRTVSVTYTAHGKLVHQDTEFRHYHFGNASNSFSFDEESQNIPGIKRVFTTLVARSEGLTKIEGNVSQSCSNASLHILTSEGETTAVGKWTSNENLSCCSNSTCNFKSYVMQGWFAAAYSSLLPSNPGHLTWSPVYVHPSTSYENCGGVLMGQTGQISYRRYSRYTNNERCIWAIYPFPRKAVKITSLVQGLESTYDRLSVWEIDQDDGKIRSTRLDSLLLALPITFTGKVILVSFYTDSSITGVGFVLRWESTGPSDFSRDYNNELLVHNPLNANSDSVERKLALNGVGFFLYVMSDDNREDASSLNFDVAVADIVPSSCQANKSSVSLFGSVSGHFDALYSTRADLCNAKDLRYNMTSPDGVGVVFIENADKDANIAARVMSRFVNAPGPAVVADEDKCGGILEGPSGQVTYKLGKNYNNRESCIWLLHSSTSSEIRVILKKEGFESCCDRLFVTAVNQSDGTLGNQTVILTHENNAYTFPGNLLVLIFRSDSSVVGKGFHLEYRGQGGMQNPPLYQLIHRDEWSGSFHYQRRNPVLEGWFSSEEEETTNEGKILVLAYNYPSESSQDSTKLNVTVEDVVFGVDSNCKSDSLKLYGDPNSTNAEFHLLKSYPNLVCEKVSHNECGNCVKERLAANDSSPHTFSSYQKAFLAIYKPVVSTEIQNQTFHIRWDASSGCGGVVESDDDDDDSGSISYKLGSRYRNMEQCIWTVNIPHAQEISFRLISTGLESCCDNILLNSLDAEKGELIGESVILKAEYPTAVMKGPVVFVTFRSDSSVTGEGFSLSFRRTNNSNSNSTILNSTQTFLFQNYHLSRHHSSLTFPFRGGRPLGPNEILTLTYSPEPTKNETYSVNRYGTRIDIKSLPLQGNNETCESDSLKFYETSSYKRFNTSNSYIARQLSPCLYASDDVECENCNATTIGGGENPQMTVSTIFPAFIAIYKSVTSSSMKTNKVLMMEWSDIRNGTNTRENHATTNSDSLIIAPHHYDPYHNHNHSMEVDEDY